MRIPDLDIDALRAFVTVAESGGFTAAAELLGRTQSAVSVKIKRLEEVLGRRVFERTSRHLSLTRDGEVLLSYARRLLDLNDETVRRLAEPAVEGELRLGMAEYVAPRQLPALLGRFARAFPGVHVEVRVASGSSLMPDLEAGELDLLVAMREEGEGRGRVIQRDPLVWAAGEGFEMPAPDAPLPLCLMPSPCIYRSRALAGLERQGRSWRSRYTSHSMLGIQAAVTAGLGVTVVGAAALAPGMRVLGPESGLPELGHAEIALYGEERRRSAAAPLVRYIVDQLQAALAPPLRAA
ncbi:MAG TPA: LysR substrate-binding domain-containing protein [Azospirillaceae bacterium]|nr:LysR substrate-binding domain-containing protein [Azospirillaceae bacterium]